MMFRKSIGSLCSPKRRPAFVPHLCPDQISYISASGETSEEQLAVLLEELTRERMLIKSLRDENEALRSSVSLVCQRDSELADLDLKLREEKTLVSSFKTKLNEEEIRRNELKIDFQNYKQLVEVEKLKLKQLQALPLLLAGLGGAIATFLIVRGDMLLEREQARYVKFELDQMWGARVRDMQRILDEVREENEQLVKTQQAEVSENRKRNKHFLSVAGYKIL